MRNICTHVCLAKKYSHFYFRISLWYMILVQEPLREKYLLSFLDISLKIKKILT